MADRLDLVSSLREAAFASDSEGAVAAAAAAWLVEAGGFDGVAFLAPVTRGVRHVLAAWGALAELSQQAWLEEGDQPADSEEACTVANGRLRGVHGDELTVPNALVLPADGDFVSGVLVLAESGELPPARTEQLRVAALLLDRELELLKVRSAHRERVKELEALRGVQVAIGSGLPTPLLLERVGELLAEGLQYVDAARAEIEVDGHQVAAGADGELAVELGRTLLIGGRERGRLRAGYVRPLGFLDPEEPQLVGAVAEALEQHLALAESRAEVAASTERLRRVMEELPAAVWTADAELVCTVVAVGGFEDLGPAGLVFHFEHWHDPIAPQLVDLHRAALRGETVVEELRWRGRWWSLRLEPLPGPDGAVGEVLGVALDVSEQHLARELEARLAAIVEGAALAIVSIDLEGCITSWNRGAAALFGWEPGEVVGHDVTLLAPADPAVPGVEEVEVAVAVQQHDASYTETVRRHRDGHDVEVGVWVSPATDTDATPFGVSCIYHDLTERNRARRSLEDSERRLSVALERERRAAEELRRLDELKTGFLRAVSHELRTPLTAIIGFAETAERIADDPEEQRPYLRRVVSNARRLEGLVSDLLDVERLARGQVEPRVGPVELDRLAERIVRRADPGAHLLELDLAPVQIAGDVVMIERAVDNLVRNALLHTPSGTTVTVRVRPDGDGATIIVEDDGPGVPPELRDRIFEPFEQGPNAGRRPSPGTGIGLSLVRRFVDLHAGTVTLDERPGGGARFTIRLPGTPACGDESALRER